MARSFSEAIDETKPGVVAESTPYAYGAVINRRRKTFSQVIADATRGIDAGMAMPSGGKVIDESQVGKPAPDWRGHYNGADAPPTPYKFLDLATQKSAGSLYVHRPLANAQQLWDWANDAGIPNLVPPHEMHATQVYSRKPVDLEPRQDTIIAKRRIAPLGDKGAVVLHFDSPEMQARHREAMAAGASHDWPTFQTHVTLSYDASGVDLAAIGAPSFPLEFGPEVHAPINENWAEEKGLRTKKAAPSFLRKYDPDEPRDDDGKWTDGGGAAIHELAPHEGGITSHTVNQGGKAALKSYARHGDALVNGYLRDPSKFADKASTAQNHIAALDKAMAVSTTRKEMIVYRGGGAWTKSDWQSQTGKTITLPAYVSTSMSQRVAAKFGADSGPAAERTNFRILVPAGSHALARNEVLGATSLAENPFIREREVLLPRGSSFTIDRVEPATHTVYLRMARR